MRTPNTFVEAVSALSLPNTFNPYRDLCPIHDQPDAAARRQANLRRCLEAALDACADTMWVARDLGYRGGRRTGVPLTDEAHLSEAAKLFRLVDDLDRATRGPAVAERTATITWKMLTAVGRPVVLWNVFPLHPHEPDDPMSNRCHRRAERAQTWPLLEALVDMINPTLIVAIGRDAGTALSGLEIPVETVRHPSYGGQADFIAGIRSIYSLGPSASVEPVSPLPFAEYA